MRNGIVSLVLRNAKLPVEVPFMKIGDEQLALSLWAHNPLGANRNGYSAEVFCYDSGLQYNVPGLLRRLHEHSKPGENRIILQKAKIGVAVFENDKSYEDYLAVRRQEPDWMLMEMDDPQVSYDAFESKEVYLDHLARLNAFDGFDAIRNIHAEFEKIIFEQNNYKWDDIVLRESAGLAGTDRMLGFVTTVENHKLHFYLETETRYGVYLGL